MTKAGGFTNRKFTSWQRRLGELRRVARIPRFVGRAEHTCLVRCNWRARLATKNAGCKGYQVATLRQNAVGPNEMPLPLEMTGKRKGDITKTYEWLIGLET